MKHWKQGICFFAAWVLLQSFVLCCVVSAEDVFSKNEAKKIYDSTKISELTSEAYALADVATGAVVFQKNGEQTFPIGNMAKIMTLYLTFEAIGQEEISLDSTFGISKEAQQISVGRKRVFLDAGKHERISVEQAVTAIGIASANDAAYALAEFLSGGTEQAFVEMMNEKAKELGMRNTVFLDSTGILTEGQYTTAHDMALLGCALVKSYPAVLAYTKQTYGKFQHSSTGEPETVMISTNNLTRDKFYPESDGILHADSESSGYSQTATVEVDGKRVVAVVMGASSRNIRAAELKKLMEYGLTEFEYRTVQEAGTFVRKINIEEGKEKKIKTATASDFGIILNKADFDKIEREVVVDSDVKAPIAKGEKVGEIIFKLEGEEIGRIDIVTDESMARANWFIRLIRKILSWLGLS